MNRTVLLVTFLLVTVSTVIWPAIGTVDARAAVTITHCVGSAGCFRDTELRESIAGLKQQGGPDLWKVYKSLLTKARTPQCRTQLVQALISSMAQDTNPATNQYENFFFWQNAASMLADLKATEALDLLIANIDFTDGWSIKISDYHTPALVAILEIGRPAIPKLQIALTNDSVLSRRYFAAYALAYIGGGQARRALESALPVETDPCLKNFIQVSLKAFNNKEKPNHISSALKGKWVGAFYCVQNR